jgi:DNA-binding SARP family transcriptional activator
VLRFHLLGPPQIEWQGQPLPIPRRQARALLFRLAAEPKPLAREQLCFLFWPDIGEAAARCNLNRLISLLRRTIPARGLLVAENDLVGIDPNRVWADTEDLARAWTAWRADGQGLDSLQRVLDLYRGPFLAGFSLPGSPEFDNWTTRQREHWQRTVLQGLAALVEDHHAKGLTSSAIEYAQRYLAIDDLAEEMHRRLIELYARAGDRSAALRQYERCVVVLERELGVDPLPETQAVYQAVLKGRVVARPGVLARPATPPASAPLAPTVPYEGREAVDQKLWDAFDCARGGRCVAVLISGEPGIGKSRVLREFAQSLAGEACVISGACYDETRTAPYQPILEAVRVRLAARPPNFASYPVWLPDAARLLPELRPLHPGLAQAPPGEPRAARARLFDALANLLFTLAGDDRPVLLGLDDLHWADSATLDWLAYLRHHAETRPLLLVGTYRSENAARIAPLRDRLEHAGRLHELILHGLDVSALRRLLCHVNGGVPVHETVVGRLQEATGGNPFFLLETARALLEGSRGLEEGFDLEDLPLPATVRIAVRSRLERLGPGARQILEGAAVLGHVVDFAVVQNVAGRQEMETVDALDELVVRQILREEASAYRFCHELVREVVYQDLGYHRRQLLHRRAAETLERLRPADSAGLAYHFERGGLTSRAARYALQTGQAARHLYAHGEARYHFDHALALLAEEMPDPRDPEAVAANRRLRIEALSERGWALRLLGDMAAYARDLEEEARLAGLLGDDRTLAHLRWRQASAQLWFCRDAEALAAAEEGLRLSRAAGDLFLEASCERALGLAARAMADYGRAQAALERATSLFAELGATSLQVHTLGNLSTMFYRQGEFVQALELAQRALELCEAADLAVERRIPLGDMGAAVAALGDAPTARRCLAESLALARQISDRTQEILCLGHLGWLAVGERRPDEAVERLAAALALAERIESRAEQSWLHAGLAEALRLGGDLDAAAAHAQKATDLANTTGRPYDQLLARRARDALTPSCA